MSFLRKISFYFVALTLVACSDNARVVQDGPKFHKLADVLAHEHPVDLYASSYGPFKLETNSLLQRSAKEADVSIGKQGQTVLRRDEKGNFHLKRIPFKNEWTTDLIYLNREYYLRSGSSKEYQKVRQQTEFDQWLNIPLTEIFSLFNAEGFATQPANDKHCYVKETAEICVDPATGLPLTGILRVKKTSETQLEVRFQLMPAQPNSVQIHLPSQN